MPRQSNETIDDIVAELRIGYTGEKIDEFFRELADRIDAAHSRGIVEAMEEFLENNG